MSDSVKNSLRASKQDYEIPFQPMARWHGAFSAEKYQSMRSDIIWRLPLLYVLFGVLLGLIINYYPKLSTLHTYFLMCGMCFMLCLQLLLNRVNNAGKLYDILYLICGMTAILPLGFLVSWPFEYTFLLLVFFTQAICWMLFPWPLHKSLSWAIFLLVYWTIILNLKELNVLGAVPLVLILIIAIGITRLRFQELNLYLSTLFLTKLCSVNQSSLPLCLQFCKLLLSTMDCKKGLVVLQDGNSFRIGEEVQLAFNDQSLEAKATFAALKDRGEESGELLVRKEDPSMQGFIFDHLGKNIRNFQYYFIRMAEKNIEKEVLLLIPNRGFFDFLRMPRLRAGIKSLFDIYNVSLFTFRNQAMSNDTVLAYGTAIADREADINQLVHTVNNKAQEISVHCDQIKHLLRKADDKKALITALEETSSIEQNVRYMTQRVSDIKLLRELCALRAAPRIEKVPLVPLAREIEEYLHYWSVSKGAQVEFLSFSKEGDGALAASSDYLEAVLRMLIDSAFSRSKKGSNIRLSLKRESELIVIELLDSGHEIKDLSSFKAANLFGEFSKGSFKILEAAKPFSHLMKLELQYCEVRNKPVFTNTNWVLFVDDNHQIVNFYSRIAEVLGLTYYTADSYESAMALINSRGKPRLLVTDIQLTDSSGLDLVKYVRMQFGEDLPVIVVSGNDDSGISDRAYKAGANRYLKKPLGRKKLFSEIEQLL